MSSVGFISMKKRVPDARDGYPCASLGDKAYQAPEYSPEFHKFGSTLPLANFGGPVQFQNKPDTFIPLVDLPDQRPEPYIVKARRRENETQVREVELVDAWRPATPLGLDLPPRVPAFEPWRPLLPVTALAPSDEQEKQTEKSGSDRGSVVSLIGVK